MVEDHLVHVVARNRTHDVLLLLVVPHLRVFVQLALVQLVKKSKWTRLVVLLLLLPLLLLLRLTDQENLLLLLLWLLLVVLGLNVEIIRIPEILAQVLGLLRLHREKSIDVLFGGDELQSVPGYDCESRQQFRISKGTHAQLNISNVDILTPHIYLAYSFLAGLNSKNMTKNQEFL